VYVSKESENVWAFKEVIANKHPNVMVEIFFIIKN
jgi:hypothetical protein